MAIPQADLDEFKRLILEAKRPLFFYDDDADGLCSYLLAMRARGDGIGVRVHNSATVTADLARKVQENIPDLIVILDKPYVDTDFFDSVHVPVLWLDHHSVQHPDRKNVLYLNPRMHDDNDNRCTTYWVWRALGRESDLWIAAIGTVCDWQITEVAEEFMKQRPDLLTTTSSPPDALYSEPFGTICKMIYFNLKGDSADVRTSIKILSRVESPDELLHHDTPRAKLLHKRYQTINKHYEKLVLGARAAATEGPMLFHIFAHIEVSLISELSNQMLYEFPDKIIFVGREHNGEHKFSIRGSHVDIASAVRHAMTTGVHGNAGGHTHACGGNIKSEDFPKFVAAFKEYLKIS